MVATDPLVYDRAMAFPPQPPGSGYGAPPFGPPPGWQPVNQGEPPPNHTMSLVAAFGVSVASFFCCGVFFIVPLIFAIVAASQASSGNHESARRMAKISTIIGGVMVVLGVLLWIAYILLMVLGPAGY